MACRKFPPVYRYIGWMMMQWKPPFTEAFPARTVGLPERMGDFIQKNGSTKELYKRWKFSFTIVGTWIARKEDGTETRSRIQPNMFWPPQIRQIHIRLRFKIAEQLRIYGRAYRFNLLALQNHYVNMNLSENRICFNSPSSMRKTMTMQTIPQFGWLENHILGETT